MATLEQFGVLLQITDQTFKLVRNMRSNANDYIAIAGRIDAGTSGTVTVDVLASIMKADADAFLNRIATLTNVATRNQTMVQNALGIIGETLANASALKTTLTNVCNHTKAATLLTTSDCTTEANYILSNVPSYEGLY